MACILIAEDDASVGDLLSCAIRPMGHTTILCSDGMIAWDRLHDGKTQVDMVITDVIMPRMRGDELLKFIRQDEKLSNLPVLVMSGAVSTQDLADLVTLNPTTVMHKPVDIKIIRQHIERCLLSNTPQYS